jgi:hypothetical protein
MRPSGMKPGTWFALGFCCAALLGSLLNEWSFIKSIDGTFDGGGLRRDLTTRLQVTAATQTAFDNIAQIAYQRAFDKNDPFLPPLLTKSVRATLFELDSWTDRTLGGLKDADRVFLARHYSQAESVFEYGLGESTHIANHVRVPRYAGIDSDAVWVQSARDKVAPHFRFYFADIGPTGAWGKPVEKYNKAVLNYQLVPLISEPYAFDVYMVDGRYRIPCVLASFLHASSRSVNSDASNTVVLLHDRHREYYHAVDDLFEIECSEAERRLCALRRLPTTTDQDLMQAWQKYHTNIGR